MFWITFVFKIKLLPKKLNVIFRPHFIWDTKNNLPAAFLQGCHTRMLYSKDRATSRKRTAISLVNHSLRIVTVFKGVNAKIHYHSTLFVLFKDKGLFFFIQITKFVVISECFQ